MGKEMPTIESDVTIRLESLKLAFRHDLEAHKIIERAKELEEYLTGKNLREPTKAVSKK